MIVLHLTMPDGVLLFSAMHPSAIEQASQPTTGNSVRTAYEDGIPMASVEIHGDKWCVLGNDRVPGFVDDSLLYSKREVFGFALVK